MTHEEMIIILTEKVLTLEAVNKNLVEESRGWEKRCHEIAKERDESDKGLQELRHFTSQQNLEIAELKENIKRQATDYNQLLKRDHDRIKELEG